jgi:hypothetical protein
LKVRQRHLHTFVHQVDGMIVFEEGKEIDKVGMMSGG